MGKSVVTYLPTVPEYLQKLHLEVPKQASYACFSQDEAIMLLKRLLGREKLKGNLSECDWINGNDQSCSDIMDIIETKANTTHEVLDLKHLNKTDSLKPGLTDYSKI